MRASATRSRPAKTVYLCGSPATPCPAALARELALPLSDDLSWFGAAVQYCLKAGLKVVNPLLREGKGSLNSNGNSFIAAERSRHEVEAELLALEQADFVLANLHRADLETLSKLIWASQRGLYTVVWTEFPVDPWLVSQARACFGELAEALADLHEHAQHDLGSVIGWAKRFEVGLRERSERLPPPGELDSLFFPGAGEILLLAPYATAHWHGANYQPAEYYTGALTAALHKLTGLPALLTNYCLLDDPLAPSGSYQDHPYQNVLAQLIERVSPRELLVLRGQTAGALGYQTSHPSTTGSESIVSQCLVRQLVQHQLTAEQNGTRDELQKLSDHYQRPVTAVTIPRVQRLPEQNPAAFYQLTSALAATLQDGQGL